MLTWLLLTLAASTAHTCDDDSDEVCLLQRFLDRHSGEVQDLVEATILEERAGPKEVRTTAEKCVDDHDPRDLSYKDGKSSQCAYYKKKGECDKHGGKCKQTCGLCPCVDEPDDRDKWYKDGKGSQCEYYQKKGACDKFGKVCKKSCGVCPEDEKAEAVAKAEDEKAEASYQSSLPSNVEDACADERVPLDKWYKEGRGSQCEYYRVTGACDKHGDECKKTCGKCAWASDAGSSPTSYQSALPSDAQEAKQEKDACADEPDERDKSYKDGKGSQCAYYKKKGECGKHGDKCRKTCGKCASDADVSSSPTSYQSALPPDANEAKKEKEVKQEKEGACADEPDKRDKSYKDGKGSQCAYYLKKGECSKFESKCQKTCGTCPCADEPDSRDSSYKDGQGSQCAYYKKKGECDKHGDKCQKTCDLCT